MTEEVVAGLLERRAKIAGEIEQAQAHLRGLIGNLDSLDAALRVFAPHLATETERARPVPPQHQALRGAVKATIEAALREAKAPVTTETLAYRLMEDRRLPLTDARLRKLFIQRVGASLFHMARRGKVQRVGMQGRFNGWEWLGAATGYASQPR